VNKRDLTKFLDIDTSKTVIKEQRRNLRMSKSILAVTVPDVRSRLFAFRAALRFTS